MAKYFDIAEPASLRIQWHVTAYLQPSSNRRNKDEKIDTKCDAH